MYTLSPIPVVLLLRLSCRLSGGEARRLYSGRTYKLYHHQYYYYYYCSFACVQQYASKRIPICFCGHNTSSRTQYPHAEKSWGVSVSPYLPVTKKKKCRTNTNLAAPPAVTDEKNINTPPETLDCSSYKWGQQGCSTSRTFLGGTPRVGT